MQSTALSAVADGLGVTAMQVPLGWLLQRTPNIPLIPDTSSIGHLRENLVAHISLGKRVLSCWIRSRPANASCIEPGIGVESFGVESHPANTAHSA